MTEAEAEYVAAFEEWDGGEDAALWEVTAADGLVDAPSSLTGP